MGHIRTKTHDYKSHDTTYMWPGRAGSGKGPGEIGGTTSPREILPANSGRMDTVDTVDQMDTVDSALKKTVAQWTPYRLAMGPLTAFATFEVLNEAILLSEYCY